MTQAAQSSKKPVLIAFLLAILVGGIGGAATEIGPWYYSLIKPAWQPPDWAFGPIWTLIYITTGIAGVRAWRLGNEQQQRYFLGALLLNCALNLLWSLLFFKIQRPDIALIEVVVLWLSILPLILLPLRYSPRSSLLLLPYLAWVSVAAYLNLTIVRLNPVI
ncbi:MAG: tryptophan-rich sensory protein [Betaproteobacteria bacterium]|nr:tryptophan-rich sensory protein [Betaproteobacteria bacterium]